jgi:hypothetical protein
LKKNQITVVWPFSADSFVGFPIPDMVTGVNAKSGAMDPTSGGLVSAGGAGGMLCRAQASDNDNVAASMVGAIRSSLMIPLGS